MWIKKSVEGVVMKFVLAITATKLGNDEAVRKAHCFV
jgi:hypothetical protein